MRAKFVPLFEQYDVDLVIHGHDGIYERSQKNGVVYIQVSSGLFDPQYAWNQTPSPQQVVVVPYILSALVVEATPTALKYKAYSPWVQVLDEGTILP